MAGSRAVAGPRVNWPWSPIPDHAHAVAAARQASVVAGLIAVSYVLLALLSGTGANPFAAVLPSGMDARFEVIGDVVLAGPAVVLAVAIHRRPRLSLVLLACLWGAVEAVFKIFVVLQLASAGNASFIGGLFVPVIMLLVIVTALRGAFSARRPDRDGLHADELHQP